MNKIRETIGTIFEAPMGRMSFVAYFSYVNTQGKLTARSIMEVCVVLLEFCEIQEKQNAKFEENFKEIEEILKKLVDKKNPKLEKVVQEPLKNQATPSAKPTSAVI